MIKKIIILILILAVGAFAYFRFSGEDGWLCVDGQWKKHGNPSAEMPKGGCGEFPSLPSIPVILDDEDVEPNIIIESPKANEEVVSPIKLKGLARVFENNFNYRLTDSEGVVLSEGYGTADSPDVGLFGVFDTEIYFKSNSDTGTLEVFSQSAKDGEEINKVIIPLFLKASEAPSPDESDIETLTVKVYFMNNKLDPEITCGKVFPVERVIPKTQAVAKAAIEELLKGPSDNERYMQYTTQLNDDIVLNKITILEGVATVDFNSKLDEGVGGSCRVGLIRKQIEETLKQFNSVKDVVISIEGNSEEILQP